MLHRNSHFALSLSGTHATAGYAFSSSVDLLPLSFPRSWLSFLSHSRIRVTRLAPRTTVLLSVEKQRVGGSRWYSPSRASFFSSSSIRLSFVSLLLAPYVLVCVNFDRSFLFIFLFTLRYSSVFRCQCTRHCYTLSLPAAPRDYDADRCVTIRLVALILSAIDTLFFFFLTVLDNVYFTCPVHSDCVSRHVTTTCDSSKIVCIFSHDTRYELRLHRISRACLRLSSSVKGFAACVHWFSRMASLRSISPRWLANCAHTAHTTYT